MTTDLLNSSATWLDDPPPIPSNPVPITNLDGRQAIGGDIGPPEGGQPKPDRVRPSMRDLAYFTRAHHTVTPHQLDHDTAAHGVVRARVEHAHDGPALPWDHQLMTLRQAPPGGQSGGMFLDPSSAAGFVF